MNNNNKLIVNMKIKLLKMNHVIQGDAGGVRCGGVGNR